MKQKIIIKLPAECNKCRSKAMQIASQIEGVISVGIEGPDRDELVVIGNEVDAAFLVCTLRKKFPPTRLKSVEEVKPEPTPPTDEGETKVCVCECITPYPSVCREGQAVVFDSYSPGCSIM